MVLFFPNEEIELWDYAEEKALVNIYGEYEAYYYLVDVVPCDFQPMSPQDNLKEFGKILQDTYKAYFDEDAPIKDTMVLRIVGKPDTFKIKGTPIHNNHFLNHKKIILEKHRKPVPLDDYDFD